jgi:pilus assembly protein CpaE
MSLKLSIVAPTPQAIDRIRADVATLSDELDVRAQVGAVEAACASLEFERPELLVAELTALSADDLHRLEVAVSQRPQSALILLSPNQSPEFLLGAMRAGVREVVPTPLKDGEFKLAINRQVERLRGNRASERNHGTVLAFVPTKGGSGATFLATSLAHALSCKDKRVAIIDLNLHLGDASIFLSDKPVTTTMAELATQEHRLDGAFLESAMLQVDPNLWLLASPESPDAAMGVRAELVGRVVTLARQRFDFVVLDLSRVPDGITLRALDESDQVYLVAQTTLPFLHDGKRLLTLLRELGYPQDKLQMVINRVEKGGDLSPADARRTLGFNHAREIPNSYAAVAYAINHGLPLLKHAPRDPVARSLAAWADELAPSADKAATRGGWLRGLGIGR